MCASITILPVVTRWCSLVGVVSSESRIVTEFHSANIGVNELLGWTLLLQQAICLEPGDTHYHKAERRGCVLHGTAHYRIAQYECCPNYPVFWRWHLVDLLTLTSLTICPGPHNTSLVSPAAKHNFSWWPQANDLLQSPAIIQLRHIQTQTRLWHTVLLNIFISLMRSDATQLVKTQGTSHYPRVCLAR